MTVKTEQTRVCDDCRLIVAGQANDYPGVITPEMVKKFNKNLPGDWYDVGHSLGDHEEEGVEECANCDWESSPRWVCPGCGVTNVMFNDMHLIEKRVN